MRMTHIGRGAFGTLVLQLGFSVAENIECRSREAHDGDGEPDLVLRANQGFSRSRTTASEPVALRHSHAQLAIQFLGDG